MTMASADVVICGAGIAGIAAAYHLAVEHGVARVVLVDARPPLSLTAAGGDGAGRHAAVRLFLWSRPPCMMTTRWAPWSWKTLNPGTRATGACSCAAGASRREAGYPLTAPAVRPET